MDLILTKTYFLMNKNSKTLAELQQQHYENRQRCFESSGRFLEYYYQAQDVLLQVHQYSKTPFFIKFSYQDLIAELKRGTQLVAPGSNRDTLSYDADRDMYSWVGINDTGVTWLSEDSLLSFSGKAWTIL